MRQPVTSTRADPPQPEAVVEPLTDADFRRAAAHGGARTAFQQPEWVEACRDLFGESTTVMGFRDWCADSGVSADTEASAGPATPETPTGTTGVGEDFGIIRVDRRTRAGATTLVGFPSSTLGDYTDVLLSDTHAAPDRMVQALLADGDWDTLDLGEVPPWASAWRLASAWPGPVVSLPSAQCPIFEARTLDELSARLPSRRRRQLKRELGSITRAGVTWAVVDDPAEVPAAVDELLAFHQERWRDRGMNTLHATAAFRELLIRVAASAAGRLVRFRVGERVAGYCLLLADRGWLRNYLVGYDTTALKGVNRGVLELVAAYDLAGPDLVGVDFLRGAHADKLKYATAVLQNRRVVLVRPGSLRGQAYAAGLLAREAARRSPVRSIVHRVRAVREHSAGRPPEPESGGTE